MYVPHLLYPFIYQQTFRLLPCLGYCKQCCHEHRGACIFSNQIFLQLYAWEWDCWIYFQFSRNFQTVHTLTFLPTIQEGSLFSPLIICIVFGDGHSDQCEVIPQLGLICICLLVSNVEHLFMCLSVCLLCRNVYLGLLPILD